MKRTWRLGRWLLALLLVSVAISVFVLWRHQPLWQVPDDRAYALQGFDETKRLVFTARVLTSKDDPEATPLRCYHFEDGEGRGLNYGELISNSRRVSWPPELLHHTPDRRYQAALIRDHTCVLTDIGESRELHRVDILGVPRFTPDGKNLVIIPRFGGSMPQRFLRFRLIGTTWMPLEDLTVSFAEDEHLLCCGEDWFATARQEISQVVPAWVNKVPLALRQYVEKLWHRDRLRVRVWDLSRGTTNGTLYIPLNLEKAAKASYPLLKDPAHKLIFSPSGRWLAVLHDGQLRLWDVHHRHTLTSWSIGLGLNLLAAWLAWPRKKRAAPVHAPQTGQPAPLSA
jgi:hypothetical protein